MRRVVKCGQGRSDTPSDNSSDQSANSLAFVKAKVADENI